MGARIHCSSRECLSSLFTLPLREHVLAGTWESHYEDGLVTRELSHSLSHEGPFSLASGSEPDEFGSTRLSELSKKVLVSAFDLDRQLEGNPSLRSWKAKFFHNFPGPESDGNETVVDVGLFTSAAPTYFPIYKGYIDGGVVACNPSVCALAQALHQPTGGQALDDIVLLSLGTGRNPRFVDSMDGDWGLIQWAPQLVHLVMEGSTDLADYQCRQILRERYLRLNPLLPYPIGLADFLLDFFDVGNFFVALFHIQRV